MIVRLSEASHNLGNLLFIHGMCHGAWCWDQGFMQLFTKEGYNCYAINLRKHDSSGKTAGINKVSIQDYLQNIKAAISEIGDEVILIGHSMGGFMIQKYLEKHHIERAVLIGSVPPTGILPAAIRYLYKHPEALPSFIRRDIYAPFVKHASDLYHPGTDKDLIKKCQTLMCAESFKVLYQMMFQPVKKPTKAQLFVIGAAEDQVISQKEINSTAKFHGVKPIIMNNLGHNMMLDKESEQVSNRIMEWLS